MYFIPAIDNDTADNDANATSNILFIAFIMSLKRSSAGSTIPKSSASLTSPFKNSFAASKASFTQLPSSFCSVSSGGGSVGSSVEPSAGGPAVPPLNSSHSGAAYIIPSSKSYIHNNYNRNYYFFHFYHLLYF